MKKTLISGLLLITLSTTVSCVDNPYVTEDNYLDKPNAGSSWIIGLQKQLALTTNIVVINTEITSDNYFNNYTQYTKIFDIPQIDYFDPDVNNLQSTVQTLREMAVYGLNTVAPKDSTLKPSDLAFMHFCLGYSSLLSGELFVALPESKLGKVIESRTFLTLAIQSFEKAYALETDTKMKNVYALLQARAYYRLGDKNKAKQQATLALSDPKMLYNVKFDGKNNVPNEMQNAVYDALPNRLAPLPRLDYLDPKFFSVGTPQNDQKPLALVKVEEAYLILSEVALASNQLAQSKDFLYQLLDLVAQRPVEMVDDKKETRNGGKRIDYPLKAVGVKFSSDQPVLQGYVLDRQQGKVPVYMISGTKVTKAQVAQVTSENELLYLIYLLRQEIFFAEGRRLTDLGIKFPISQIEQGNNPNVKDEHTKALIPSFIPNKLQMDDFTVDKVTGVVTMKYDMNRVLIQNKTDKNILPLFK
ncbi:tetratricopeptide repeat protein [Myroides sp. M-43]|uniref:tetratricopeptide repeat protein n=1 Tax=Myroides oncorhynchi TaxID=2893756 RepID=UPI001E421178|nr:tetratricopeptide repeat protein [Myroides oncorhynchi]MCC9043822.1 tetratricopeptide repeat protein [Myroides oncorhynchi]